MAALATAQAEKPVCQNAAGEEGIELAYERQLAGRAGSRRVIKDRLGRVIEDDWLREPVDGRDIALSIDNRVQYIAFSALKAAVEKHQARAGAAVIIDVRSGELLALVNWPSYDPNARGRLSGCDPIEHATLALGPDGASERHVLRDVLPICGG